MNPPTICSTCARVAMLRSSGVGSGRAVADAASLIAALSCWGL
ncbi:MAG TPA: hypothetical protein VE825_12225 [Terriglobales bacterium]|nr:hypothetical protein [Terriglobales bacterium]